MNRPLQVGITGGIGSGKSLICKIFHCLGVPVYDADSRAKWLMSSDEALKNQIRSNFGNETYKADGTLDRSYLGKLTFQNPDKLNTLNSLVHPRVAEDYRRWTEIYNHHPYLLREAALLYETGIYKSIDKMIVVSAPEALRIKRVLSRDTHRSEADVRAIMKNQWTEEEKLKRADFIIKNNEEDFVIPQVLTLHEHFNLIRLK